MSGKLTILLLLLTINWIFPGDAAAQKSLPADSEGSVVRIGYLEGTVRTLVKGTQTWRVLTVTDALRAGDALSVGSRSRVELILPDRSYLRFADNTHITIIEDGGGSKQDVKVHLAVGRAWAKVSKALSIKRKFEIVADNAITGVRGTIYRMNVAQDASALVRVYEGEIAVSGAIRTQEHSKAIGPPTVIDGPRKVPGPTKVTMEEWTVIIRSMQQISISSDGRPSRAREFTEQEDRDEWVDWNKARDKRR